MFQPLHSKKRFCRDILNSISLLLSLSSVLQLSCFILIYRQRRPHEYSEALRRVKQAETQHTPYPGMEADLLKIRGLFSSIDLYIGMFYLHLSPEVIQISHAIFGNHFLSASSLLIDFFQRCGMLKFGEASQKLGPWSAFCPWTHDSDRAFSDRVLQFLLNAMTLPLFKLLQQHSFHCPICPHSDTMILHSQLDEIVLQMLIVLSLLPPSLRSGIDEDVFAEMVPLASHFISRFHLSSPQMRQCLESTAAVNWSALWPLTDQCIRFSSQFPPCFRLGCPPLTPLSLILSLLIPPRCLFRLLLNLFSVISLMQ